VQNEEVIKGSKKFLCFSR